MFRRKPSRRFVFSILAMALCGILVALALRPIFIRKAPPNPPRVVMLSDLYQNVVNDARGGYRDTITIEGERVVAATTSGTKAAWTGGSDALGLLSDQLKEA